MASRTRSSNFLGGVDGISMKVRTKKLISSLRFYNATPEKWIGCYAEFCQSNALIRGNRLTEFCLLPLYGCVRRKYFHL
jgi:hypothetical protein